MRTMAILAGLAALALGGAAQAAASNSLPPAAASVGQTFLTQLKAGKSSEAFHFAFHDLEPQMGSQAVDNISAQLSALFKTFGNIVDWSNYETDEITPNLIRQTYFVRCTNIPLFLTVQYYNPGGSWRIIDVQANTYTNGKNAGFYGAEQDKR